jgi:hypothetical protein
MLRVGRAAIVEEILLIEETIKILGFRVCVGSDCVK